MNKYLLKIEQWITNIDLMYAHTPKSGKNKESEILIECLDKEPEKLMEHLTLTVKKLEEFDKVGGYFSLIKDLIRGILKNIKCFDDDEINSMVNFLLKAVLNAVYLHDIGKCNIAFQMEIMKNKAFKDDYVDGMSSNHSLYSAKIYLDLMSDEANEVIINNNIGLSKKKIREKIWVTKYILVTIANCIVGHHSRISDPMNLIKHLIDTFGVEKDEKIESFVNPPELANYTYQTKETVRLQSFINNPPIYNRVMSFMKPVMERMYVLTKWIYSAICLADSLSTTDYINGVTVTPVTFNIDEAIENFRKDVVYEEIMKYKETGKTNSLINQVRSQMFLEADYNLVKNIDKNIFYLEAPTGGGKTTIATNLALRMMELTKETERPIARFIYTSPFNAITTQTAESLEKLMEGCPVDTTLVNCSTPIPIKDTDEEFKYQLSLLDNQMLNYPITLTSHVKLFQALFGTSRIDNHMLLNMANSVVIIDEIQAYNPMVWAKMMRLIDIYSKYLNIKFIIMSATLPKIGDLIDIDKRCSLYVDLIDNCEKYFVSECFKSRVEKPNYSLVDGDLGKKYKSMSNDQEVYRRLVFDSIIEKIKMEYKERDNCKVLVEFISKKSAEAFYTNLKNIQNELGDEVQIKLFTGETSNCSRKNIIELSKQDVNLIIVATQCIEAGVDISMNIGFKDISYIDSEEQFAGRLNRNFNNIGITRIYFFKLDDADAVYGKDIARFKGDMTVLCEGKYREYFENKNYADMFREMTGKMYDAIKGSDAKITIDNFDNKIKALDYLEVENDLELIPDRDEIMLFFPIDITVREAGVSRIVSGREAWNKLSEALLKGEYAEKKIETKNAMVNTSYFCYKFNLPWKITKNNNLEEVFVSKLKENHISYTKMAGMFKLDLNKDDIRGFIDFDDDYRFNRDNFSAFLGIDIDSKENKHLIY